MEAGGVFFVFLSNSSGLCSVLIAFWPISTQQLFPIITSPTVPEDVHLTNCSSWLTSATRVSSTVITGLMRCKYMLREWKCYLSALGCIGISVLHLRKCYAERFEASSESSNELSAHGPGPGGGWWEYGCPCPVSVVWMTWVGICYCCSSESCQDHFHSNQGVKDSPITRKLNH